MALGLIGVLEVLWQTIAFQSEASIDRTTAVERSLNYLRSVFPGQFREAASAPRPVSEGSRLPASAYTDEQILRLERERLLWPAWQLMGHDSELRKAGDFVTGDLAGERAMIVRGERGRIHAFRNTCRRRPHALLAPRKGHLRSAIHCAAHSLTYDFDGRLVAGGTAGDLAALEMARLGPLLLVRASSEPRMPPLAPAPWESFANLLPRSVSDHELHADWKIVVEQWLEALQPQQQYVTPNLLLDILPGNALILQVTPLSAGRSRIRRFDFADRASGKAAARSRDAWQRRTASWLKAQIDLAESTQAGLAGVAHDHAAEEPAPAALAEFRESIARLLRTAAELAA